MTWVMRDVMPRVPGLNFSARRYTFFWLLFSYYIALSVPLSTVVQTDKGKVRGYEGGVKHRRVNVYTGIPFAKPPVGDLRFKLPVPNPPWSGVLNATILPNACIQAHDLTFGRNFWGTNQWNPNTNVSEDCLYINIWAPADGSSSRTRAVMVWIYGGGFVTGSALLDVYDGTVLAAYGDVIVVTIAYRVGALGFISFGHYEAPGNAAMFDQLMGLDWIQRNIHAFGGDPKNVTLFGESAGSVSVSLHLLSPLSRVKFSRAILQSGVANLAWSVITREESKRRSYELAKHMKCVRDDVIATVACLRTRDAMEFPSQEYKVVHGMWQFSFVPIVDGTFVVETPILSLRRGQFKRLPLLMGTNMNEGTWLLPYLYPDYFQRHTQSPITQKQFRMILDAITTYFPRYPYLMNSIGKDAVIFQYTPWHDPTDQLKNRDELQNIVGDYHMVCGCTEFARYYADHGQDVFYYSFNHRSSKNEWPRWMGVMHGDEIHYVFGLPLRPKSGFRRTEKLLSEKMIGFWSNYAKTGNPNFGPGEANKNEWPIYQSREYRYLTLATTLVRHPKRLKGVIGHGPRTKHCAFWKEYIPQLIAATVDMPEAEVEWKKQFNAWSTEYIVDWRHQFENFVASRQKRYDTCHDGL